jgi:hypothetical protein
MNEWSKAFDNAPIYIHASDKQWIVDHSEAIIFWEGEKKEIMDELMLVHLGGHFPGSTAALWTGAADGKGVLLTGDTIHVAMDRKTVSFMYSFPNLIPLSATSVQRISDAVQRYHFDRIYGGFEGRKILASAREAVAASAMRYVEHLTTGLENE